MSTAPDVPTPAYNCGGVRVFDCDALDVLRAMPDCSVHSVVCDPQYGLSQVSSAATIAAITAWVSGDRERVPNAGGFMGAKWDSFVPPPAIWDECLRVLTPGGHLLAFAGSRMADLAGLSIRLAGFEVRDGIDVIGSRISWLYGTGMPKAKTVLKPAHEPILVARKPCAGSEVATVQRYGTGALNVEACRVSMSAADREHARVPMGEWSRSNTTTGGTDRRNGQVFEPAAAGRWPPNVVLLHAPLFDPETGEVIGDACADGCVEGCAVSELDRQSGVLKSGDLKPYIGQNGRSGGIMGRRVERDHNYTRAGDSGGASRYFPTFRWQSKAPAGERPTVNGIAHPTVKPLSLIRWLVRLVTPQGGTVLDWCAGSGTTGEAAQLEGFPADLIEREPDYLPLIKARLERNEPDLLSLVGVDQ